MERIQKYDIALLGCGRLGQGIFKLWQHRREKLIKSSEIDINIKYILIKHPEYKRDSAIPKSLLIHNLEPLIKDDSIKVVIDAIGGIEPTFTIIRKFLEKGCHLVSANRSLLASKMKEIFEIASRNKLLMRFDSALIGGLPLYRTLRKDLIACKINVKSVFSLLTLKSSLLPSVSGSDKGFPAMITNANSIRVTTCK